METSVQGQYETRLQPSIHFTSLTYQGSGSREQDPWVVLSQTDRTAQVSLHPLKRHTPDLQMEKAITLSLDSQLTHSPETPPRLLTPKVHRTCPRATEPFHRVTHMKGVQVHAQLVDPSSGRTDLPVYSEGVTGG